MSNGIGTDLPAVQDLGQENGALLEGGADVDQRSDPRRPPPWAPSPRSRFAELNLVDPLDDPAHAPSIGDALMAALIPSGSTDPVEGILSGVRSELVAIAAADKGAFGSSLEALAKRIKLAILVLRWCDNTERMPPLEAPFIEASP